jgi:hypothetical protein
VEHANDIINGWAENNIIVIIEVDNDFRKEDAPNISDLLVR